MILGRWLLALTLSAAFFSGAAFAARSAAPSWVDPAQQWPDISDVQWPAAAVGAPPTPSGAATTLVLYDDSGEFQPLSQLYGTMATALTSHFGTPTTQGVSAYAPGQMATYSAVVYLGTNAEQSLPPSLVADVRNGSTPVLWLGGNLDELAASPAELSRAYGWTWTASDPRPAQRVSYKDVELSRSHEDAGPLAGVTITDGARAQVLATALFDDGSTHPWAVRSGNLTYVTEVPLDPSGVSTDRYLAVCDLFFDLLRPDAVTRHRALLRLEDVSPASDPDQLRRLADMLDKADVPFSFALYPVEVGPLEERPRRTVTLSERPAVVAAVAYLLQHGGTMVLHGYTHQFEALRNPDTGGSGADFEFFRVTREADGTLVYDRPVPGDSVAWATDRLRAAIDEVTKTGLPKPEIFEFPHYAASAADYEAAGRLFDARYDRPQYLTSAWTTGPMSPYMFDQYAPYVVRDGYGSTVIPENLGYVDGPPVPHQGVGSLQAIVDGAQRNLVVRDGVASFFYHPYLGTEGLSTIVGQMQELGYDFVSPSEL